MKVDNDITAPGVTALAVDPHMRYRARYGWFDDAVEGGLRVERYEIVGWACGRELWPVRVDGATGHGVLVGADDDPDRDALLVVGLPGADWESRDGMDSRIRAIIREGAGVETGEADVEIETGVST